MNKKQSLFQRSLQAKLVLWVGLCLVMVGGLIIGYAAYTSYQEAVQTADEIANAEAEIQANYVKAQVEVALDSARTLSQTLGAIKTKDQPISLTREQVNGMLRQVLSGNPNFLGAYTLWEPNAFDGKDKEYVDKPGHDKTGRYIPYWNRGGPGGSIILDPLLDYETAGIGDYYQIPKKTLKESIIDPYIYPIGGKNVLLTSLVVPIVVDGKFYGICGIDLALDSLQEIADNVDIYNKTGKLALISHGGTFAGVTGRPELAGKTLKDEGTSSSDVLSVVQEGKKGSRQYGGNLEVYIPIYFGAAPTPWSVRVQVPNSEIVADANRMIIQMVLIAVALIALGLLGIWLVIDRVAIKPLKVMTGALHNLQLGNLSQDTSQEMHHLMTSRFDEIGLAGQGVQSTSQYLKEMAETAHQISEGNLTVQVALRSDADELGLAFTHMVENLRTQVGQVAASARGVSDASNQLAMASSQAGAATSQISTTIQQVAKGISQQTESIGKTAGAVEQMGRAIDGVARGAQEQSKAVMRASEITQRINAAIQQVAGNAKAVTERSAEAAAAARNGHKTVEATLEGMNSIRAKVGVSAEKVREMGNRSNQIGAIVETIDDIASQTNLLALNAAIEAARAGEHGKGFAVVADEVRKLAERSSQATKEIGGLIKGIQKIVGEAVSAMEAGASEIENGVARASDAGTSLTSIMAAAEAVLKQAQEAGQATGQVQSASSELVSAIDAVSAVVEENTAATEQMSANSSEVTQAVESIASVSEENSAAVEEVSASTEEMTAQVEEVTASAQELANMASALNQVVAQFKL
ncbi:MAG TPA: methyl-accepting chemotaxis protein [Anaerolineaceae bacterium]